jgi:hypothetical protein
MSLISTTLGNPTVAAGTDPRRIASFIAVRASNQSEGLLRCIQMTYIIEQSTLDDCGDSAS